MRISRPQSLPEPEPGHRRQTAFHGRRGGVPIWIPLGLLTLLGGLFGQRLRAQALASGISVVDVQAFDFRVRRGLVLPDWERRLADLLAYAQDLSVHDRDAIEALAAEIEALTFVAEVGVPEVIWPDGLSLPVRLHVPVANVRVGPVYMLVSEEAVVLAGANSLPHVAFGLPLPVLGPLDGSCDSLRPGMKLEREDLLDGLATAHSMWQNVDSGLLAELGCVMIDASRPLASDGFEGGVCIDLESRRRIQFGRPPRGDHPGELPTVMKWESVVRGIRELQLGHDWDLLDVRWDQPDAFRRAPAPSAR